MGRRATFTEADIRRAMKVARGIDPRAVVEVTSAGTIRILPEQAAKASKSEVEDWFSDDASKS